MSENKCGCSIPITVFIVVVSMPVCVLLVTFSQGWVGLLLPMLSMNHVFDPTEKTQVIGHWKQPMGDQGPGIGGMWGKNDKN